MNANEILGKKNGNKELHESITQNKRAFVKSKANTSLSKMFKFYKVYVFPEIIMC